MMLRSKFFKITYYVLALFFVVFGASCGSKKLFIKDGSVIQSKSDKEIFADILDAEVKFRTITTKGKIGFNGKEVSAIFKIVKNEIFQVSIRPVLGIEMARIDITPEKILFLDRFNKQYTEVTFEEILLTTGLDLNFYNLQAILTDKLFIQGNQALTIDDFKLFSYSTVDNHYVLSYSKNTTMTYDFFVDAASKIDKVKVYNSNSTDSIVWSYSEFIKEDSYVYPTALLATLSYSKKKVEAKINYNKLSIDADFQVDQSIPAKYVKRSLKEIVAKIVKL